MESCSSKLDKIKFTIEEIKGDMEKMKIKNEQTLNEMMNSMDINEKIINTINMIEETNNNSIESDKETKEDLIRKYDTYELSEEKNEPKLIDISDNNMSNTISENNSTYDYKGSNANYQKMTIKYQTEIAKLKAKMASMIKDNEEISARLEREKKRKEELIKRQKEKKDKEEKIINEMKNYFDVKAPNEILLKIESLRVVEQKDKKLREELIMKVKNMYVKLTETNEDKDDIDIQILWRWIKHLMNTVNELQNEKERNVNVLNDLTQNDIYHNYFAQIINDFNLKDIDELKFFINELISINTINKKRVQKLKKVLLEVPNSQSV